MALCIGRMPLRLDTTFFRTVVHTSRSSVHAKRALSTPAQLWPRVRVTAECFALCWLRLLIPNTQRFATTTTTTTNTVVSCLSSPSVQCRTLGFLHHFHCCAVAVSSFFRLVAQGAATPMQRCIALLYSSVLPARLIKKFLLMLPVGTLASPSGNGTVRMRSLVMLVPA